MRAARGGERGASRTRCAATEGAGSMCRPALARLLLLQLLLLKLYLGKGGSGECAARLGSAVRCGEGARVPPAPSITSRCCPAERLRAVEERAGTACALRPVGATRALLTGAATFNPPLRRFVPRQSGAASAKQICSVPPPSTSAGSFPPFRERLPNPLTSSSPRDLPRWRMHGRVSRLRCAFCIFLCLFRLAFHRFPSPGFFIPRPQPGARSTTAALPGAHKAAPCTAVLPRGASPPARAYPRPLPSAGGSRRPPRRLRDRPRPRDSPGGGARPADPGAAPCLAGAVKECDKDQFQCRNERCIPAVWACDEDNDCSDNSDEADCREYPVGRGAAVGPA